MKLTNNSNITYKFKSVNLTYDLFNKVCDSFDESVSDTERKFFTTRIFISFFFKVAKFLSTDAEDPEPTYDKNELKFRIDYTMRSLEHRLSKAPKSFLKSLTDRYFTFIKDKMDIPIEVFYKNLKEDSNDKLF